LPPNFPIFVPPQAFYVVGVPLDATAAFTFFLLLTTSVNKYIRKTCPSCAPFGLEILYIVIYIDGLLLFSVLQYTNFAIGVHRGGIYGFKTPIESSEFFKVVFANAGVQALLHIHIKS